MADDQERRRGIGGIGDSIRSGFGVVSAFVEAIEDTIQEAVDRGDLSPDRARQTVRDATRRFQEGIGAARERLDIVPRQELEELQIELAELRRRVDALEAGASGAQEPPLLEEPDSPDEVIPLEER